MQPIKDNAGRNMHPPFVPGAYAVSYDTLEHQQELIDRISALEIMGYQGEMNIIPLTTIPSIYVQFDQEKMNTTLDFRIKELLKTLPYVKNVEGVPVYKTFTH